MSAAFQLPSVGSTANWGSIINDNFTFLSDEIKKLYSSFNTVQALVGANTPYIKIDENQYFLQLEKTQENENSPVYINFHYYAKESLRYGNNLGVPTATYKLNTSNNTWDSQQPPFFLGAYIFEIKELDDSLNEKNEPINITGTDFYKNDFIVHFHALGSLYGNNAVSASVFKKYPPMGEYYKPVLNTTNPYKLQFEKIDYVDWFRNEEQLTYTLPSVGYGTFVSIEYGKDASEEIVPDENGILTYTYEFNINGLNLDPQNFGINVNYYLVKDDTKENIIIYNNHVIEIEEEEGGVRKSFITINCDISGLDLDNEKLRIEICVIHNQRAGNGVIEYVEAQ